MQALSTPYWLLQPQEWNGATLTLSLQWSYSFPEIVLLSYYLNLTCHGASMRLAEALRLTHLP